MQGEGAEPVSVAVRAPRVDRRRESAAGHLTRQVDIALGAPSRTGHAQLGREDAVVGGRTGVHVAVRSRSGDLVALGGPECVGGGHAGLAGDLGGVGAGLALCGTGSAGVRGTYGLLVGLGRAHGCAFGAAGGVGKVLEVVGDSIVGLDAVAAGVDVEVVATDSVAAGVALGGGVAGPGGGQLGECQQPQQPDEEPIH